MSNITVNVPLERFKELEQAEETLNKMLENEWFSVVHQSGCGTRYWVHDTDEVNKRLAYELKRSEETKEAWRKELVALKQEKAKKKPWGFGE
jgi:hypothetical protein